MNKISKVKVRMYRHGFGDCFLLRFTTVSDEVMFKMLIDCGLKMGDKIEGVEMDDVIKDIKDTTGSDLDVLVATHEHWDHISGFDPKEHYFDDVNIKKVWLGWTENPNDEEARTINTRLRKGAQLLAATVSKIQFAFRNVDALTKMHEGNEIIAAYDTFKKDLSGVLEYYGIKSDSGISYSENINISLRTQEALENLLAIGKAKNAQIEFLTPGQLLDEKETVAGLRVYVLGPPKNKWINKSNPSKANKKEVYLYGENSELNGFINAISQTPGSNPFKERSDSEQMIQAQKLYYNRYVEHDEWRKIDNAWLTSASSLALQLDNAINNTSLVLAIELVESGKILLFPGDAQVGSWESWHELEWEVKNGNFKEKITLKDLLKKTVLYKVSHHASHNATLKEKGLEEMTHPELAALIPVKADVYKGIPHPTLIDRLREKCKGRVFFSTGPVLGKTIGENEKDFLSKQNVKENKLYIEYTVEV